MSSVSEDGSSGESEDLWLVSQVGGVRLRDEVKERRIECGGGRLEPLSFGGQWCYHPSFEDGGGGDVGQPT